MFSSDQADLVWPVSTEVVAAIKAVWKTLLEKPPDYRSTPSHGHRGVFLRSRDEEWFSYNGFVVHVAPQGVHSRIEPSHTIESLLLHSTPPGILPTRVWP